MQRQSFTLMVQGTTSDAGKSTLVAGLCRLLVKSHKKVAPFKPQNMALNSAVTQNGGEIGRAQALQAVACGLAPHTDMNPVLIKPSSDTNAQIIVHGHALENMQACTFHDYKPRAMQAVLDSYSRLVKQYDVIVVEGAGSPAEINLRQGDIANMGFAEAVDCPVIIVADIDRGGVFAHLVGTLELLDASEKDRVIGFVINRFRGDITLLQSGLDWLEQRTCKPVLGVIPYIHNLYLDAEDAIDTQQHSDESANALNVIVPVLPRISNHTDFDALRMHPKVNLAFVPSDQPPTASDLIIIPGTKNVRDDWAWLCQNGWDTALKRHLRYGGKLIGICGGYQMLGEYIHDPDGVEGVKGTSQGIGLIPMETTLHKSKKLERVRAELTLDCKKVPVDGYEIHCGKSILRQGSGKNAPISYSKGEDYCREGYINADNTILGTYLHGLFDHPQACQLLLQWAGLVDSPEVDDLNTVRQRQIDRLADTLEEHIDFDKLEIALEEFYRGKKSKG